MNIEGSCEGLQSGEIIGWVIDLSEPGRRLRVAAEIDGEVSPYVLADLDREDVRAAGIGDGACGFSIPVNPKFIDGREGEVTILVEGMDGAALCREMALCWEPGAETLIGGVEGLLGDRLVGWAFDKASPKIPVPVEFRIDGVVVGRTLANGEREDLEDVCFGSRAHGAEIEVPAKFFDGKYHEVSMVARGQVLAPSEKQRFVWSSNLVSYHLDKFSAGGACGWLRDRASAAPPRLVLSVDGEDVNSRRPHRRRDDIAGSGEQQFCGFRLRLPFAKLTNGPGRICLRMENEAGKFPLSESTVWLDRPRVIFISNASDPTDGSRYYRGDLQAEQLRQAGLVCDIFSEQDAGEALAEGRLDFANYGIVIFLRCPLDEHTEILLPAAREAGCRVFGDVDDLNFKVSCIAEIGAVRSGLVQDEGALRWTLQQRLGLLQRCDAVFCSSHALYRELLTMGVRPLLSRNAIADHHFRLGALRHLSPLPKGPLRVLYASGTPTHRADFAPLLPYLGGFLKKHADSVRLTILGDARPGSLASLSNVDLLPRQPLDQMFEVLSQHDVGIVPLEETSFNLSKSSLKFMEAAAAGIPVIASDLFEFHRDIKQSGAGWLASSPAQFIDTLEGLVNAPRLVREHGVRAHAYAFQQHSVSSRGTGLWDAIVESDGDLCRMAIDPLETAQGFSKGGWASTSSLVARDKL